MKNRTVLITGAAKNIGATIAKELHSSGMKIIIHYNRSQKEATKLVDELNDLRENSAIKIQADLKKKGMLLDAD